MDLQALRFFQAVAREGSISKAARLMNYAQSNLTARIQQLEADFRVQLFYRHNRGMTLTEKGKMLLTYTDKIFQLIDEVENVMIDDETPQGSLVIGSMETTAAVRLPSLLSRFHRTYPDIDFTLKTGPTEQNVQGVLDYQLDGAFVAAPVKHQDLIFHQVIEEELVLITDGNCSVGSFLEEIENQTILVFRKGCSYRAKFEEWLRYEGIIPRKLMEFGTLDGMIGCVCAGLGVSLLPRSVVEKYAQNHSLVEHTIPQEFGRIQTLFVYRKDRHLSTAFQKFIEMIDVVIT